MSATRTQIYLSDEQRARIDRTAASEGVSMAEVIRRAIDQYLGDEVDPSAALSATFGADPDAGVPSRGAWHRG
jgi:predicted DNA-binding protein